MIWTECSVQQAGKQVLGHMPVKFSLISLSPTSNLELIFGLNKFCTTLLYCQLTTPWCPYHPRLSTWVWISYPYLNKYLSQQVIAELKARSKNPMHFKKQLCHTLVSSLPLIGSSNRNDKQENLMENKILQKMIESEKLRSHTVPWPLNGHFNV